MLARISSLSATGLRSSSVSAAKTAPKVSHGQFLVAKSLARCYSNFVSTSTRSLLKTSSTVSKPSYPLQKTTKRTHVGCGMSHGGDEVPGVGMERELRAHLNVTSLVIEDTSGNGSFYYVEVESPDFAGKTTLACHKEVQAIIAKQIEQIHGFRIKTRVPKP